jgi:hypothetical protein
MAEQAISAAQILSVCSFCNRARNVPQGDGFRYMDKANIKVPSVGQRASGVRLAPGHDKGMRSSRVALTDSSERSDRRTPSQLFCERRGCCDDRDWQQPRSNERGIQVRRAANVIGAVERASVRPIQCDTATVGALTNFLPRPRIVRMAPEAVKEQWA